MTIYLGRKSAPRTNYSDAQKVYALGLRRDGYSYERIADLVGAPNPEAVRHMLKRLKKPIAETVSVIG